MMRCQNQHRYTLTGEQTPGGWDRAYCDECGRLTSVAGSGAIWPTRLRLRVHEELRPKDLTAPTNPGADDE